MSDAMHDLVEVVAQLRDPNNGCPWDLKQTHQTLVPYVLEEAHEVVDAIRTICSRYHDEQAFCVQLLRLGAAEHVANV